MSVHIYFACAPEDAAAAGEDGRQLAHVAYRIGTGSALLRQNLPVSVRGGLLCLSDRDAPGLPDPGALCAATVRECGRRSYAGVLLDFEEPYREDLGVFAAVLSKKLLPGRRVYLPGPYAAAAPEAVELIGSAISGGNFREYLREAAERRRKGGLALDAERLRMDFCLPAPTGTGVPLDGAALDALRQGRPVFFSQDLCARYFTCQEQGQAHFVLFDDGDTLNRKLRVAEELGIDAAFFQWPEVRDIADTLRTA